MDVFVATCGDMTVRYLRDETTGVLGMEMWPTDRLPAPADQGEPLVQLAVAGDEAPDLWSQGRTLRNRSSAVGLKPSGHHVEESAQSSTVTVELADGKGLEATQTLRWMAGQPCVAVATRLRNNSPEPVTVELLASFCLGGIAAPRSPGAPEDLVVHRLRSTWSAEARLVSEPVADLGLEGWPPEALGVERFGQSGTMPVRGFAPNVVIEDRQAGITWGAQLVWSGSWQIELYRRGAALSIAGGLADADTGHWRKTLAPGESFTTPESWLTVVADDVDACFQRLVAMQPGSRGSARGPEPDLAAMTNEFATSWGTPQHDDVLRLARRLTGTPVKYLVMDAGWYVGAHGDWEPDRRAFPDGLAATAHAIRELGLVPGLWFEPETCGAGSAAYDLTEHLLCRDGAPITAGERRFWDFRDPYVSDHLLRRIAGLVDECGIGYLKIDYNAAVGVGCDGAESPGEALRRHVEATSSFYARLRDRLPDVVIENCASGGHRLEPAFMAHSDVASFSDIFDGRNDLPIIAANVSRLVPGRQTLVWAVPRRTDSDQELVYKLVSALLGRPCLSGDLVDLSDRQWSRVAEMLELHERARPALAEGSWQRFGPHPRTYRDPEGWQAFARATRDGTRALIVLHAFGGPQDVPITVELPGRHEFAVDTAIACSPTPQVRGRAVEWQPPAPFSAAAVWLVPEA